MLNFFRKHQKIFFIFVSFFIILSFSFFGTFSTFANKEEVSNREIGKMIDGSVLKERELIGLMQILKGGLEEGASAHNILSDSFLHREIILTGLGEIFAKQYYQELKTDLEARWKQMKQYRPYMHPQVSFINAPAVWSQFAPEINTLLQQLKDAPEDFSEENLSLVFALYNAQAKFPPYLLHQMLYYQQTQNSQIPLDPALPHLNAALFGFQSIEDWFGTKFLGLIGQCIINGAHLAETKGYLASKEEARVSLMRNIYKGLEGFSRGKKPRMEDMQNYYAHQIRALGLEENTALKLWQKVLSFQRLLDEVGEAAFVDSLALNYFKSFTDSKWKARRFSLPKTLQFENFRTMLKFQRYLEAVSQQNPENLLLLPDKYKSIESISLDYPELVCKSFEVELASVDQEQVSSQISLKQTWDWEKQENNFALLQQEFPILASKNGESDASRLQILEVLNPQDRLKIDQFARKSIADANSDWLKRALSQAEFKNQTLKVRLKGGKAPFSGEKILQLLETDNAVLQFSEDQITYALRVIKKGETLELVSFNDALEDGTLDEFLDDFLKIAFEQMRLDSPFEEVKDEVGAKVYSDLLHAIEKHKGNICAQLDEYAHFRFDAYIKQIRDKSMENPSFFEIFPQQWRLQVEESLQKEFQPSLKVNEFSEIENQEFYQLIEYVEGKADEGEINSLKNAMKKDAKQAFMRKMIEQFVQQDVIHLRAL